MVCTRAGNPATRDPKPMTLLSKPGEPANYTNWSFYVKNLKIASNLGQAPTSGNLPGYSPSSKAAITQ